MTIGGMNECHGCGTYFTNAIPYTKFCSFCVESHEDCESEVITLNLVKRAENMKSRYGLTSIEYHVMMEEQNHSCAICGEHFSLTKRGAHIDHCHKTNKVRSLLCGRCNAMLGMAKDNPHTLLNAIGYLGKHLTN